MSKQWLAGILLGLLALGSHQAQASVMIDMTTKELTERAREVVQGVVVQQQVVQIQGHLWTDSYVRVTEGIKGKLGSRQTMVVRQPGGETIVLGERVLGAAQFAMGEEVLVLARPVGHFFVPVGMCLGKYRIVRGPGQAPRAERNLQGASFAKFTAAGRFTMLPPRKQQSTRLSDLVQSIRRHLRPTLLRNAGGGR